MGDQQVPDDILFQHKTLADHPQGKVILKMLEGLDDGAIKNPFRSTDEKPSWKNPCLDYVKNQDLKSCLLSVISEDDQARISLPTILSICSNITQNVTNVKYRSVKKSSKRFALVLGHEPAKKLIEALGFKEDEENYILDPVDKTVLLNLMQMCKA